MARQEHKWAVVLLKMIFVVTGLVLMAGLFNISTTLSGLNWFLVTVPYLSISCLFWSLQGQKRKVVKYSITAVMICVFGIGYLLSTLGILGLMFIIGDYDSIKKVTLSDDLTCSITFLGNALSDHRGIKFEIYDQVDYLPFVDKRVMEHEVFDIRFPSSDIDMTFNEANNAIYFRADSINENRGEVWRDTIYLNE